MSIYLQHAVLRDHTRMAPFGIVSKDRLYAFSHTPEPQLILESDDFFFSPHRGFYLILDNCKTYTPDWLFHHPWPDDIHVTPLSAGGINSSQQVGVTIRQVRYGQPAGNPCCIYHLGAGDPWGIDQTLPPQDLAQAWCLASYALGVQLRFSPSYTGLVMLREELQRWGDLPKMSAEWRDRLRAAGDTWAHPFAWISPELHWRRDAHPEDLEDREWTIYKFDRNMSYVSSAGEVPVGNPAPATVWRPGQPGVYRISATAPGDWPVGMPGPFYTGGAVPYPSTVENVWAWEPQIRLAIRHGWEITFHDGFVWPEKHDLLRSWRSRIWKARTLCHNYGEPGNPVAAMAVGIVKRVGVTAIGRLRQSRGHAMMPTADAEAQGLPISWYERDGQGALTGMVAVETATGRDDLYRPEWWNTIIANAAERCQAAIYEYWHRRPIAAWVDAIYTLDDAPKLHASPLAPGKFKHDSTLSAPISEIPTQAQPFVSWYARQKRAIHAAD